MTLVLTVLQISAPVFLLAGIGFAWVRLGYDYDTAFVTRLAMTLAVPCLVFTALAGATMDPAAAGRLGLAAFVAYGVALLVFGAGVAALGLDRRTWLAPLAFGNTGNLGLPLALFAFGETGLGYAIVVFAATAILSFTVGLWLVAGGGNPVRALREPMVPATVLGAVFLWRGWPVPQVVSDALGLIGQMAIPLMLITLGVAVARLSVGRLGPVVALAGAKVAGCAALGWAIGRAFGLDGVPLAILTVQMATPAAVTSYLLAEKYGADARAVAGLVVVSTVLSIGYLPALLAIFV